jgi:hypothetical protein
MSLWFYFVQPKGKKRIADMSLKNAVLMKRLEPIGLEKYVIDLPLAEINQMVSRKFMSANYGGSMQATFPQIREEKLAEHGLDDFMYLHLNYQPYAPQTPGGCGLWFSTDGDSEPWEGITRVLTRDLNSAMWQYMGQYEVKAAASLEMAEWLQQDLKVRFLLNCLRTLTNFFRYETHGQERFVPRIGGTMSVLEFRLAENRKMAEIRLTKKLPMSWRAEEERIRPLKIFGLLSTVGKRYESSDRFFFYLLFWNDRDLLFGLWSALGMIMLFNSNSVRNILDGPLQQPSAAGRSLRRLQRASTQSKPKWKRRLKKKRL